MVLNDPVSTSRRAILHASFSSSMHPTIYFPSRDQALGGPLAHGRDRGVAVDTIGVPGAARVDGALEAELSEGPPAVGEGRALVVVLEDGALEVGQAILAFGDIAFIDKGVNEGVGPGQMFTTYYREKEKMDPKKRGYTLLPPIDFGSFIVLHSEDRIATVFILKASQNIQPGTNFRSQ